MAEQEVGVEPTQADLKLLRIDQHHEMISLLSPLSYARYWSGV
jgi:hypothetical protein